MKFATKTINLFGGCLQTSIPPTLYAVERVKKEWRTVRELGELEISGQKAIQLQCYFGSHTYNTKEFSVLLNGVLDEAKELGIETLSEADKDLLLKEWSAK